MSVLQSQELSRGIQVRHAARRATLSVMQIALTFALVIGTILLARTVRNLYAVNTGLAIDGVLALPLTLPRDITPTRGRES